MTRTLLLLSVAALTGFHPRARAELLEDRLNVRVERVAENTAPAGRTAEVSGVFGSAFASSGEGDKPVRTGTLLAAGTTIRTDSGAAMDVYLGKEAGVIRLTQNTTVRIERLAHTNGQSDIYLHLQQGTILGNGSKGSGSGNSGRHASGSGPHASGIKTAIGIAEVGSAAFRLHAEGYLVVLSGTAHFAHVPATGEPKLYSLKAPPAVYFSPTEGVKPAPKELVREVVDQSRARLGQDLKGRAPSAS
jgi:hypothetical protein